MSVTGERDGKPTAVGESIADVATGMFAAWGIAAALYDRERTGVGRRLEVAMLNSVFSMLLTSLSRRLFTDQPTRRVGSRHPETYPVDRFATTDGDIVLVGFSDAVFRRIGEAIGMPGLADDPRFKNNADRNVHEAELRNLIEGWAAGLTREQALSKLREADVPAAPVWTFDELIESGHVQARGLLQSGTNNKLGDIHVVPQPVQFAGAGNTAGTVVPTLGQDTDAVLSEKLGLDPARLSEPAQSQGHLIRRRASRGLQMSLTTPSIRNERVVRATRGATLTTKSWQTEAPLRLLMNNLDPDVAERPEELVVYGGIGRAARSWEAFD